MLFENIWGPEYGNGITYADELPNGDYFLVGGKALERVGNIIGPGQFYSCRIDSAGNILWEKDWGNVYEPDGASRTIKNINGTYLIIGKGLSGIGGGIGDMTATNIDVDGNILFHKYYDFYYEDFAMDAFETIDSCFIICGSAGTTPNNHFPALLKIDHNGNEIWRRTQSSLINYAPSRIGRTNDKGFICLGSTGVYWDTYLAKYDSSGAMSWIKYPYGQSDTIPNVPRSIRVNANGTFDVFFGTYYTISSPQQEVWSILKHFDSLGNCMSSHEDYNRLLYIERSPKDSSFTGISFCYSYYKMDSSGIFQKKVTLMGNDSLTKYPNYYISTHDGGYLAVGNYSKVQDYFTQFYIAKFGPDGRYQPTEFSESVCAFPNPSANGNITLTFDIKQDNNVIVDIFTSEGKLVYSNSIFCPANSHTELPVRLDEISANGGMYILQAKTSDAVIRKKLVVMRQN